MTACDSEYPGATLNEIVLGAFWDDERVRRAVGEDPARVPAMLASGPNAAAHRARREAAEQAALAAAEPTSSDPPEEEGADPETPPARLDAAVAAAAAAERPHRGAATSDASPVAPAATEHPAANDAARPANPGPHEIVSQGEDLPFDRPWTLGVPAQETTPRPAIGSVLRVARAGGPTRR